MPVRILTIPFDASKDIFDDEILTKFLLNKNLVRLTPEFFSIQKFYYKCNKRIAIWLKCMISVIARAA